MEAEDCCEALEEVVPDVPSEEEAVLDYDTCDHKDKSKEHLNNNTHMLCCK